MNRPNLSLMSLLCLIVAPLANTWAQDTAGRRQEAQTLAGQGNWNDALIIYKSLIADSAESGADVAKDLKAMYKCMESLGQYEQLDPLIATALETHPRDWRVLSQAANLIGQALHRGVLTGQTFVREQGEPFVQIDVTTDEEDRIQALQWFQQALELCGEIKSEVQPAVDRGTPQERGRLWADLLTALLSSRDEQLGWKLLLTTDLHTPVNYAEATYINPSRHQVHAALVDENGRPVLHSVPESWSTAGSDGQRARWALTRIEELGDPETKAQAIWKWADFLDSQFSVRPLTQSLSTNRHADLIADVHLLDDGETLAQLAGGIQRIQLPDQHNPLRLFQQLAQSSTTLAAPARAKLIQTYLDRRQFAKAASIAREWLAANPAKSVEREEMEGVYNAIVKPAASFRAAEPQAAGRPAKLDLAYRNATKVTFVARSVNRAAFLKTIQDNAGKYNQLRQIYAEFALGLSRLHSPVELDDFLSEPVATWSQDLPAAGDHAQQDITITTPLDKGGIYMVEATLAEGAELGATKAKCLLWINDLAIVYKTLQSGTWMLVADAATGVALPHVDVEFIALNRDEAVRYTRKTNAEGIIEVAADDEVNFKFGNWFAVVRDKAGRFASTLCLNAEPYRGWMGSDDAIRIFGVTDRPVYRPGDKVRAKIWLGQVDYRNPRPLGNHSTILQVHGPQSNQVWFETVHTDAGGAIELNFDLPRQSTLGVYSVSVGDLGRQGSTIQFRVEDFRKPEFQVKIETAKQTIRLGEAIEAKIQAKYFFGAPVSDGVVQLRVLRHAVVDRFNPLEQFSWCFGSHYREQADESFPTWAEFRARGHTVPTELVFDQPLKLGADGTAKIRIETTQAARLLGQQDHEYEFVAEVRDAARRTHTATGLVTATYRPFNLYANLNRRFFTTGENVEASFVALTVAGQAVQATGKLELLRLNKDSQGTIRDELMQSWDAQSDHAGRFVQRMVAGKPGQYKLRVTLKSTADKSAADKSAADQSATDSVAEAVTFDVHGDGESIKDFDVSQLKIVTDKREYAPGETVQLQVNSDRTDTNVWLFVRPFTEEESRPQLIQLVNGTARMGIKVLAGDQPNFFVEAITIRDGRLVEEVCEIFVPPADKALDIQVQANKKIYEPGEKVELVVDVKDANGRPAEGDGLIAVYDRALEQIDPEMLPVDILQHFWKRRRVYYPQTQSTLYKSVSPLFDETAPLMQPLGRLDPWELSDEMNAFYMGMSSAMGGGMGGGMGMPDSGGLDEMGGMGDSSGMGMMGASNSRVVLLNERLWDSRPRPSLLNTNQVKRVRSNFVDSAAWVSRVSLDAQGRARTSFTMPENLTDWQVRVWAVGPSMEVGSSTATISSNKELQIRLVAPRFLNERDQVTLSAIVHNQTNTQHEVKVGLEIDKSEQLGLVPGIQSERSLKIAAHSEQRVEWKCTARAAGHTAVRAKVISATHSDAMEVTLPIQRCAFVKKDSWSGMIPPDDHAATRKISIPPQLSPEASRLTIQVSGSVGGSILGALPYLDEYPYGCSEQTLDRFTPAVIVRHALRKLNVNLAQLKQLYDTEQASASKASGLLGSIRKHSHPPFLDDEKMRQLEVAGVARLAAMQNSDGGWGWYHGQSSAHATATVVRGLLLARNSGARVEVTSIFEALEWLKRYQTKRLEQRPDPAGYLVEGGLDVDALVFHTLVMAGQKDVKAQARLFNERNSLSLYSKVLLALATHHLGEKEQTEMLMRNIEQFMVVDLENDTAFLRDQAHSWYWYSNRIEANALYLKLLVAVEPNSNKPARVARYLLSNRRQVAAWESTRDTALMIEALSDYLLHYGEPIPSLLGEVLLNGKRIGTFRFNTSSLMAETQIELTGADVPPGEHELEIRKQGTGPLFYSVYATNLTNVEEMARAGLEVKVDRRYYQVASIAKPAALADSRSQPLPGKQSSSARQSIDDLHALTPGALVEVELIIESKNDYEHILIHEPRAAGMETVETKSGLIQGTKLQAYGELCDDHIAFFIEYLPQGRHVLRYQMRCESPGQFTALPAVVSAMYAPALVGNSRDNDVLISE